MGSRLDAANGPSTRFWDDSPGGFSSPGRVGRRNRRRGYASRLPERSCLISFQVVTLPSASLAGTSIDEDATEAKTQGCSQYCRREHGARGGTGGGAGEERGCVCQRESPEG